MKNIEEIEKELQKIEEKELNLKRHKELLLKQLTKTKLSEEDEIRSYQQKFCEIDAKLYRLNDYYYIEHENVIVSKFSASSFEYGIQTIEKALSLLTIVYNVKKSLRGTISVNGMYSWGAIRFYLSTNPEKRFAKDADFSVEVVVHSDNTFSGNISYVKEIYGDSYMIEQTLDYEVFVQNSNDEVCFEVVYDWKFNANEENIKDVIFSTLNKLTEKAVNNQQ